MKEKIRPKPAHKPTTEKDRNSYKAILKYLMLGLIYPAVLGSILYLSLEEGAKQARSIWHLLYNHVPYDPSYIMTVKFFLLFVTLTFYSCDFLYITFTNNYRWWFFGLDLLFVLGLYSTAHFIHIDSNYAPQNVVILMFYEIFIILYFIWDLYEARHHPAGKEKEHYLKVVKWEIAVFFGLIPFIIIARICEQPKITSTATLVALVIATISFAKYTLEKRTYYEKSL
jgi:hypothetical protein